MNSGGWHCHRVPVGPIRAWCQRTLEDRGGDMTTAAEACGVTLNTFKRFVQGEFPHGGPDLYAIDRLLSCEGSTCLEELYPYDEYPPPAPTQPELVAA